MRLSKNRLLTNGVCVLQGVEEALRQLDHGADVAEQPVKVYVLHLKGNAERT